ncbi:MAG TPA: hypothetical protein VL588_01520 [Bdellovibrionota bacterium]|jgi:hypothetical protein|nr:hypothetical protein [Bdellovibrionota bacterium]
MVRWGIALLFIALAPSKAWGAGDGKGFVGIEGGFAAPTNTSTVFTFGVQGMYRNSPRMGLGAFLITYAEGLRTSTNAGQATVDSSTILWGGEIDYFGFDSLLGFRGGLRLGFMSANTSISASNSTDSVQITDSRSPLFLMPVLAYDYKINRFSLGAEASYFLGFGSGSPSGFLFVITPKFWF